MASRVSLLQRRNEFLICVNSASLSLVPMTMIPYKAGNDEMKKEISQEIIVLTHEYPPFLGGVATYWYEVGKAAREQGLPLKVWVSEKAAQFEGALLEKLECETTLSFWNLFRMVRAVLKRESELEGKSLIAGSVVAHWAAMLLVAIGRLKECRLFSFAHGSEILKFQRSFFWRMLAKKFFARVEGVFVASGFVRSVVRRNFGEKKIILAPCACSTAAATEVWPKKSGKFKILTLARGHPRKGQFETARALAQLPGKIKLNLVYRVAGRGDEKYLQKVLDFCAKNGIECEYLGAVDESQLAQTYADCDLFVMTSRSLRDSVEGFGISYLEAAWHGKPSVAFRTGGVSEAVLDKKTGYLVEEGDISALAQAIQKLIEDDDLRNFLGKQAAIFARSFDWKKTAQVIAQTIMS